MEPNKKICWKVTVSLMYAIQSGRPEQGWRFLLFESYFKMPHIIWFLRKIAEILWRWSQSRKPGGAGVNRKHIKIPVNGENGFKYEDNTCQSVRLWVTSQISNCAICASKFPPIMARTYTGQKQEQYTICLRYENPNILYFILLFTRRPLRFYIDHFSMSGPGGWKAADSRHPISWFWFNSSSWTQPHVIKL